MEGMTTSEADLAPMAIANDTFAAMAEGSSGPDIPKACQS